MMRGKASQTESLSTLSPSNGMMRGKASQTESLSTLSPSSIVSPPLILTEIDKNIEFDSVGGLRLVSPFVQLNELGELRWRQ